jgi:hypothetical protein
MPESYQVLKEIRGLFRADESIDDLKTAVDIILEYRGVLKGKETSFDEIALVLNLFCLKLPGGPRKSEKYRADARQFKTKYIKGISRSKSKKLKFQQLLRTTLKDISLSEVVQLDDFDNYFEI